jgi:plasmid stabilization system protein ParE
MRSGYFVSGIGQSKYGCAIRLCLLRKRSATTPGERCLPISCAPSSRNPERVADEPEGSVAPEALGQLQILEERIAQAGAPITAERYVDAIVDFCISLQTFAARGVAREDLLPGLRITHFRKRAIIAYLLDDEIVSILGIFYGGQDYETALGSEDG